MGRSSTLGRSMLAVAACLVLCSSAAFAQGRERPVVAGFDLDKDGRLNTAERKAAQDFLTAQGINRGGRGRGVRPPPRPGISISPADVKTLPGVPLYDEGTLRTFFLTFENAEWETEMVAFNNTDIDVPATVIVDGKTYRDVGVHFRGNSSFGVGNGFKRSLNLTFDFVHEDQAVEGYRTLNFLNANTDATLMRTVLSMHIARKYVAAPKANFVRVVINGENWGIYESSQQFDKDFLQDNFKTTKGTRWKVPQGGFGNSLGGFTYAGDDAGAYRSTFDIKSKDEPAAWSALINLAKVLQQTPPGQLEAALAPLLDVDGLLRFLALDVAMAGGDGFYQRVADYSLYLDPNGRFHFTFHDANETFSFGGGRGGPGTGGLSLDPFVAVNDSNKPIISKVLAVPALRAKYVEYVREIADVVFDWRTLGPVVRGYRDLIADDVARDTRKLYSTEEFLLGTSDEIGIGNLRMFFDQRRAFLLGWAAQQP